jgi:YggT family protein
MMSPKVIWSFADGYPVGIKQFLQFCLILVYPAFVFAGIAGAVLHGHFYITVYPVLWLLFWPVRAYQKKNNPEEYAANRAKYKGKKWYET